METELCGIFEKDVWIKKDLKRVDWCSGFFLEDNWLKLCPLVDFCPRVKKEEESPITMSVNSI